MILIINVSKEKLHYFEFVKPIEDILRKEEIEFFTRHYLEISEENLGKADKVIICGTSLKDNSFLQDIDKFNWIKDFDKPVFGICAGFQIIGIVFDGNVSKKLEIGYFMEDFDRDFFGLTGKQEVYHLHNNYIEFGNEFEVFSRSEIAQAIKHKDKEIYGTLFHPEVRNKKVIVNFAKL